MPAHTTPARQKFMYLWTLPHDLVAWSAVVVIWLLWGTNLHRVGLGLWCELRPSSWPARSWYRMKVNGAVVENAPEHQAQYGRWLTWGGTTFGHGGIYGPGLTASPGHAEVVAKHEGAQVEDYEVSMLTAALVGLLVGSFLAGQGQLEVGLGVGGAIWQLGFFSRILPSRIVTWFRGETDDGRAYSEELGRQVERFQRGK